MIWGPAGAFVNRFHALLRHLEAFEIFEGFEENTAICAHMGRTFKSRCEIEVDAAKFDRTSHVTNLSFP